MHNDAQLMTMVAAGQDDALAPLIDRWRHKVWTFVDRMCGYLGRTDDIFQDIWMRIYLYRKKFDPARTKSFKSYLFAIVLNCCRTNMKKHLPQPAPAPDQTPDDSPAPDPDPLDALINSEQSRQVRIAVARLPQQQRTIVLLYLLYDSDYSIIAQTLGLRQGTVRSHMSLALQSLRAGLLRKRSTAKPTPEGQVQHE